MSTTITIIVPLIFIAVVWLIPLYFVCQWAERNKKDHRIVFWVGFFTGWLIALIVALLLPVLSDEQVATMKKKERKSSSGEALDTSSILIWGIGGMSVIALGFVAFLKFVL